MCQAVHNLYQQQFNRAEVKSAVVYVCITALQHSIKRVQCAYYEIQVYGGLRMMSTMNVLVVRVHRC
jgi:hypothetical protein